MYSYYREMSITESKMSKINNITFSAFTQFTVIVGMEISECEVTNLWNNGISKLVLCTWRIREWRTTTTKLCRGFELDCDIVLDCL